MRRDARPSLRTLIPLLLVGALALGATACSSGSDTSATAGAAEAPAAGASSAELALDEQRVVIDVRTPDEFAAGHVAGATNIDVQGGGFAAAIDDLDPQQAYVVYCRSGNRSAIAADEMRAAGLDVVDGGGFDTMTAAGWPAA